MTPVSYYPPRVRLLLLTLGCGLAAAIFLVPATADNPILIGLGWIGVVVLGLSTVVLLARALRPGPSLVIDREGITDLTALASIGLIRWGEITVIRKKEIGRGFGAERLLEVVLADPDEFRSRPRGRMRRLLDSYRATLKLPAVSIPGSMLSVPMQVVMDEIRQRQPQLEVLEGPPPPPPRFRFSRKPQPGRKHPDLPRW